MRVTGSVSKIPGLPAGIRAAELPDSGVDLESGFFGTFGRPVRESACECERTSGMMLGPVMTLVNGPTIAEAIADPQNAIASLVASQPDDAKVVDELFVRLLSRPAAPSEVEAGVTALNAGGDELDALAAKLTEYESTLAAKQVAWETTQVPPSWTVLQAAELASDMGATFTPQPDGSVLVEGASRKGKYTVTLRSELAKVTALRLEVLADDRLPSRGPVRAGNGNFVLTELHATGAPVSDPSKSQELAVGRASADSSQNGYPVSYAIDRRPESGWAVAPELGKDHAAVFEVLEEAVFDGGTALVLTFDHQHDDQHTIGKFRVSVTSATLPLNTPSVPENIAAILAVPADARSEAQQAELAEHYRKNDAEWNRLKAAIAAAQEQQKNHRLTGAQDLAWALINSPAFLFNH
jgi:hypothetical protein